MKVDSIVCCPKCGSKILLINNEYLCQRPDCISIYRIINDVPIIISDDNEIFNFNTLSKNPNPFFKNKSFFIKLLKKLVPDIGHNIAAKSNFKFIEKNFYPERKLALILGAGDGGVGASILERSANLIVVKTDVYVDSTIDYVCDAHNLPFPENSFDLVVIQAVLEHVIDPELVVSEVYRVLRESGWVYAETPFMQQVHGAEYDFTRWTRSGHRKLFRKFSEIKSGQIGSVGMSLAWSIEYFIKGIIKYKAINLPIIFFLRYFTFIFKYFDYIAINSNDNRSSDGASGFYFIGKKSDRSISDKNIINYYH